MFTTCLSSNATPNDYLNFWIITIISMISFYLLLLSLSLSLFLSLSLSFSHSLFLSLSLSFSLSLSLSLSISISISLFLSFSISLYIYLSIYIYLSLPFYLYLSGDEANHIIILLENNDPTKFWQFQTFSLLRSVWRKIEERSKQVLRR